MHGGQGRIEERTGYGRAGHDRTEKGSRKKKRKGKER